MKLDDFLIQLVKYWISKDGTCQVYLGKIEDNEILRPTEEDKEEAEKLIKSLRHYFKMTSIAGMLLALIMYLQYFTNWIIKSSSFIPISKYVSVKCLKS